MWSKKLPLGPSYNRKFIPRNLKSKIPVYSVTNENLSLLVYLRRDVWGIQHRYLFLSHSVVSLKISWQIWNPMGWSLNALFYRYNDDVCWGSWPRNIFYWSTPLANIRNSSLYQFRKQKPSPSASEKLSKEDEKYVAADIRTQTLYSYAGLSSYLALIQRLGTMWAILHV